MVSNYSIKKTISFIKNELRNQYPDDEISSLTSIIFEYLFNYTRVQIYNSLNQEISTESFNKLSAIISELKSNKPIQYILGETSFYDLPFKLTSDVLIPRQETEELVDWIIKENNAESKNILDIGTGSGCIAISLAKNLPHSKVSACDISTNALTITRGNSKLNNVNIQIIQLDILNPDIIIDKKFDIIVSNPPYVTEKEKSLMHKNVLDFEPKLALYVPNEDPLLFYKAITRFALNHLNPKGIAYFEVNEAHGEEAAILLKEKGFREILLKKDINGKNRMLRGTFK